MYKCEILADSKNLHGDRITTMKITFPRFILAEFNTHRMFSRNSASSRAIPFKKMVKMVEENPFIPIAFQRDHKGMQGSDYLTGEEYDQAWMSWKDSSEDAIERAKLLHECGTTKQLCNRLLEPFMWHTVIVTSTEWENFFKLRCPQYVLGDKLGSPEESNKQVFRSWKDFAFYCYSNDIGGKTIADWQYVPLLERLKVNQSQAEIHIQAIAEMMWDAMNASTPKILQPGEWHIPFGDNMEKLYLLPYELAPSSTTEEFVNKLKIKIATARCARISYETLGDNPKIDYESDIKLHDMLMKSGHWSPFEHVAVAMDEEEYESFVKGIVDMYYDTVAESNMPDFVPETARGWCRNFRGFIQYRCLVD